MCPIIPFILYARKGIIPMQSEPTSAATPNLRLIPVDAPQPHEEHDYQRAQPLIKSIKRADVFTNPPIVTQTADNLYIILDGANRCHSLRALEFPHILVQVVSYNSGQVQLESWNHVVSGWNADAFLSEIQQLPDVEIHNGQHKHAIAHVYTSSNDLYALTAPVNSVHERNAALRDFVRVYQQNAHLNRTPLNEPDEVWDVFRDVTALVVFPGYAPRDIIEAARYQAYLPPGISRHIVQGRALQVNYPIDSLKDTHTSLADKNAQLEDWLKDKFMNRQVRYYAEATYQFSE